MILLFLLACRAVVDEFISSSSTLLYIQQMLEWMLCAQDNYPLTQALRWLHFMVLVGSTKEYMAWSLPLRSIQG